jgi:type I restriction enzyme R subunit
VSLIRKVAGIDQTLTPYDKTVDKNFKDWIFQQNAGKHNKFTEEQMDWLRMLKDHVASSFHIENDDLDYNPFDTHGGRGKMWQLFGDKMNGILDDLNEALVA